MGCKAQRTRITHEQLVTKVQATNWFRPWSRSPATLASLRLIDLIPFCALARSVMVS